MAPTPETLREALEWLDRAQRDLEVARRELGVDHPLLEMTAYHAQQAGEKALLVRFVTAQLPT